MGTARGLAGATLALAGIVHLAIGPEHLAQSVVLGVAMFAAGAAQLAVAPIVARRVTVWPVRAAFAVQAVLFAAYVTAVTVGLPVGAHGHGHDERVGLLGLVETPEPLGLATAGLELAGAALAAAILVGARRPASRRTPILGR